MLTAVLYAVVCVVAYGLALHPTGHWHAQSAALGTLRAATSGLFVLSETVAETLS